MLKSSTAVLAVALLLSLIGLLPLRVFAAPAVAPRVTAMYTTWDDYYFYAAFSVKDSNVVSANDAPDSQPQQDDDVEVFFETDAARAAVRTPQTFQMAVSAANGAYYSQGNGTSVPQPKPIYTYKYAATVNGTLNDPTDKDGGYDVELAIPWQELGQPQGGPKPGAEWGFNVVSRDRNSVDAPATRFYSLSPKVAAREDVQNPAKWSRIAFVPGGQAEASTPARIVCAKVVGKFPLITGQIISGQWPVASGLSFGTKALDAPAPTEAEEPNTKSSLFASNKQPAFPNRIDLPGGGSIKVVPGGIKVPQGLEPPPLPENKTANSLPRFPEGGTAPLPKGVSLTSSVTLGPARPAPLVMAIYRIDYNGDGRRAKSQNVWDANGGSLLVDQPIDGAGPWFSGLRVPWHRQQLSQMRQDGINVALLRARADDPLLGRELNALVEALQELKAQGQDYPLIGLDGSSSASTETVLAHVPAEFRALVSVPATDPPGVAVVFSGNVRADFVTSVADGTRLTPITGAATVSPGRMAQGQVVPRLGGQKYDASWQAALASKPDFIVIDSWNDFGQGTEIAPSRQYGEQFRLQTKVQTIQFNGFKQWHAKYLTENVPRTLYPKTLYQVTIRVENAGTLPWRSGEGYSLTPRWYKDGRLYDDSAPRLPLPVDVLPGHSMTIPVTLVARNNAGEDLEPGDYTLAFEMVQGEDRWFSYAGDAPLQIPIMVTSGADQSAKARAMFLSASTPVYAQAGASYPVQVQLRNDGASTWTKTEKLGYKILQMDAEGGEPKMVGGGSIPLVPESAFAPPLPVRKNAKGPVVDISPPSLDITPGQIVSVPASIKATDAGGSPLPPGEYRVRWYAAAGETPAEGAYEEPLFVVAHDPGVTFVLSDISRTMDAGDEAPAKLAIANRGVRAWKKAGTQIGYHWYALDGQETQWDGGSTAYLSKDVPPGDVDAAITPTVRAPKQPGRYVLVWDVRLADGTWASTETASHGNDSAQALITVGGKGPVTPVDLSKSAPAPDATGGFDGAGHSLPAEMLPPDAASEADANPFLAGKPGPPLYPSGYYASRANHDIMFLYPKAKSQGGLACQGQTIPLPGGKYKAVHLLAAATGGQTVTAQFGLGYGSTPVPQSLPIADWTQTPQAPGATVAFRSSYRQTRDGDEAVPCFLGDYSLSLDSGRRITTLVLPNAPSVKILAISLER